MARIIYFICDDTGGISDLSLTGYDPVCNVNLCADNDGGAIVGFYYGHPDYDTVGACKTSTRYNICRIDNDPLPDDFYGSVPDVCCWNCCCERWFESPAIIDIGASGLTSCQYKNIADETVDCRDVSSLNDTNTEVEYEPQGPIGCSATYSDCYGNVALGDFHVFFQMSRPVSSSTITVYITIRETSSPTSAILWAGSDTYTGCEELYNNGIGVVITSAVPCEDVETSVCNPEIVGSVTLSFS